MLSATHLGFKDYAGVLSYLPKRFFDIFTSFSALLILMLPLLLVALAIRLTSAGPAIYWSDRVGRENRIFRMPKFRTMRVDTPTVATHLMTVPDAYLTPLGKILRRASIDELPQLWSILIGDMSVVGPRPALFDQYDLVSLRTMAGVEKLTPGLTGWAQINGRDNLSIPDKVKLDVEYLHGRSFLLDLKIIMKTFGAVLNCDGLSH